MVNMDITTKKVVIVGGGFAGINLIKNLARDKSFQITLVDTNNYHFFPPLLYQVATAFIEPSNISYPYRRMFQEKKNLRFHLGCFLKVNPESNTIETDISTLEYDYLVLALGTETNYFGMENVKKYALPMKTITDALNLRNHLLMSMEKAVRSAHIVENDRFLNIVIAGGGPTGVELAGMLAEMGQEIRVKEYPEITDFQGHIYLVDAGPVLLGPMSPKAQKEASDILSKLGVHILQNTAVKDYVNGQVFLSNGEIINSEVLIWATGVIGREVKGLPADVVGRGRRLMVDELNRVKGFSNILAIGDICYQTNDAAYPDGHPQLAQVAIQQGNLLSSNLKKMAANQQPVAFKYDDKGSMAIIAKYKAVVDLPKFFFKGFLAWVVWLFIHIIPIAGFSNKLKLAFSWLYSFITNDPTLRLIIRPNKDEYK